MDDPAGTYITKTPSSFSLCRSVKSGSYSRPGFSWLLTVPPGTGWCYREADA
jgi:hypothetical protein